MLGQNNMVGILVGIVWWGYLSRIIWWKQAQLGVPHSEIQVELD